MRGTINAVTSSSPSARPIADPLHSNPPASGSPSGNSASFIGLWPDCSSASITERREFERSDALRSAFTSLSTSDSSENHRVCPRQRFLVSLVASRQRDPRANPQVTRHGWQIAGTRRSIWRRGPKEKRNRLEKAPGKYPVQGISANWRWCTERGEESDSWEDADSAFWFIVEPRRAGGG